MTSLSKVTHEIDEFISHSWQAAAWLKYVNILLLYRASPAFALSMASALAAFLLYGFGLLPPLGATFVCTWCTWSGITVFYLALLSSPRCSKVFLDIACIDQEDENRKFESVVSMGGVLKRSKSMMVLWSPTYVRRLWCVFETR